MTIPVSVLILTKNEEGVLARTLTSVRDFAQVFVIDSNSEDSTRSIAESMGAQVVQFDWNRRYPKKKEWAMTKLPLAHEWVLYLDADEVVSSELAQEIQGFIAGVAADVHAADVELDYCFLGKRLEHGHRVTKRILLRPHCARWPRVDDLGVATMWEVEGHYQPQVDGIVARLKARLVHDDLDPLYDYFARHNRYSDWEAHLSATPEAAALAMSSRSPRAQRFSRVPLRPVAVFIYSYVLRSGWRDGRAGFHYAVAQMFYLWQVHVKTIELLRTRRVDRRRAWNGHASSAVDSVTTSSD